MSDEQEIMTEVVRGPIPEIKLPFERKKFVFGVWIYNRRMGLCVTIIAYLLLTIAMVVVKITFEIEQHNDTIMVDLTNIEIREEVEPEELPQTPEVVPMNSTDWDDVRNLNSNEAIDEELETSEETQQLLDEAIEAERRMAANRASYERGMAEAEAIREQGEEERRRAAEERSATEDSNIDGNVTVSYIIKDPIRHSRRLVVPAYTCQGGGRVVIRVQLNRAGEVISANVHTGGDECMQQSALKSALASRFDINTEAPTKQSGVIVYIFVPQ